MSHSEAMSRITRLAQALTERSADAFFASHPVSMEYLHGFGEDGYERFLTLAIRSTGEVALICPALSETQARRCGITDIRTWNDSQDPMKLFHDLAEQWKLRSGIFYIDGFMPAFMVLAMQEALPAALFKPGQDILAKIMRKKDEGELAMMRRTAHIADEALEPAIRQIRIGMTEAEIAGVFQQEMRKLGGKPTFCIIAVGANSAEPHHESDDTRVQDGDIILCDYGCTVNGYNSDTTRVVGIGNVSDAALEVYRVVYESQRAARAAIRAGVPAQEIDRAARATIVDAGFGQYFIHRTGHGIGLRGHEEPYIVEGAAEPLGVGECFSIEPGIYIPGRFGVRIENIVTPTDHGHESFNAEPSETLRVIAV